MGNKWSLNDTGYDDGYDDGYNQALEDMKKAILTDKELQFAPYSQEMWFKNRIMDIAERLTRQNFKEKNMKKDAFYTPYYEVKEIGEARK